MTMSAFLRTLRKRWIIVALITLLCTAGAFGVSRAVTPTYQATSSLYFTLSFGESASDLAQGSTYTQNQMLSFAELTTSPVVLDPVIEDLELPITSNELARTMEVSTPRDTVILQIDVSHPDPAQAAKIANAVAEQLRTVVEQYAPKNGDDQSTVTVRLIETAAAPQFATSPNTKRNVALGFLVGLLGSVLLAVLYEMVDTRIRNEQDLRAVTDRALLGTVGKMHDASGGGLAVVKNPSGTDAEIFRQIRASLHYVALGRSPFTFLVTSASPSEGKSTIASNLAVTLAETGQRVLLIDADLRRPRIATYAQIEGAVGLSSVLVGTTSVSDAVQRWGSTSLDILPAGGSPPNPGELLSTKAMEELIDHVRGGYDVIVIDSAPVLAVADASALSPLVDGVVMVSDARKGRRGQLSRSLETLEHTGARTLGVILNRAQAPKRGESYGYYGHGDKGPGDTGKGAHPRRVEIRTDDDTVASRAPVSVRS